MIAYGRHVNSLATPYHMPIFDVPSRSQQGDFHGLRPRTVARADYNGVLRHLGGTSCALTLYIPTVPNEL